MGAAGLDVYEEEEGVFFHDLSDEVMRDDTLARLLTFPNVLVTAHQAFLTHEALDQIAQTTLENVTAFERGAYLDNEVRSELVFAMRLADIRAFILDLDGVVTHTEKLHSLAWKQLFDEYSERRGKRGDKVYEPFDVGSDYLRYVDGKPRQDGVRDFLAARGIVLTMGMPDDSASLETVFGLSNRKNEFFQKALEVYGPMVFPDAVDALREWKMRGMKTAVASSSKNCEKILSLAHLNDLFDARVDGTHLQKWKMPGKPAPDLFLAAARLLGVSPAEAAVLEDAVSGIRAARAGGFGLVVGVARFGHSELLLMAGADRVVSDLTELLLESPGQLNGSTLV